MTSETYHFRAGDEVLHVPSGEAWALAFDETDGRVMPIGWPESSASAADCRLVNCATPGHRIRTLKLVAASVGIRAKRAREQLNAMGIKLNEGAENG